MAGCSSGTKNLEEGLDNVLESDEEEDLSNITEPEDEIGGYEDDDGNQQLFVPFNVQIRCFPDAVERITAFDSDNENESDDDDVSLFRFYMITNKMVKNVQILF